MRRIGLAVVLSLSLVLAVLAAEAQPAGDVHRIGYLSTSSATATPGYVEAFRQGLREFGWSEGQNLVIDYRFAEGRVERLPALAVELVQLKVDVIVAAATAATVAAKNATRTIPIVMVSVSDAVRLGLIASFARPGGNATGLTWSVGLEFGGKLLELLKETLPKVRRVAILWNPGNPAHEAAVSELRAAARSLRVQLQLLSVRGPEEFDGAFAAMAKEHAEALLVVSDPMLNLNAARLADLAAKNRLPSMHGMRGNVEAGGLMSYGPNNVALYRRAAFFVDKILKGANPADLPVEQPTKFELVINLKTAKALGLTIPQSILVRADEIIR